MAVSPEDLRRYREGHRTAEARLREESLRRLALLSVEEARQEYDTLWGVWRTSRGLGDRTALDRHALGARVALRRRLDAAARRERPV